MKDSHESASRINNTEVFPIKETTETVVITVKTPGVPEKEEEL